MFVGGIGLVWPIKSAVYAGAEYISCPKRRGHKSNGEDTVMDGKAASAKAK